MDDPNITMEEYIRLEEEKAPKRGKVFNWETTKYGKIWYDEDLHDLRSVETEFPAISFNDEVSSEKTLSCEPTVGFYSRAGKGICEVGLWEDLAGNSVGSMEYLVNISKRRAFQSLNEDILKITILTTNTPYPSRKIRQDIKRGPYSKKLQYAVSNPLDTPKYMTRSSTNELFTHYKETEREFRSSRRHFKTLSLDELRSPDFNLLSDQEYSEE
ncbi:hypothetical protein Tco_0154304 [Tanacetum coccineum]